MKRGNERGAKAKGAAKPAGMTPRRAAKQRVLARVRQDTAQVNGATLLSALRKQGYEELPLEEIQDRLSKLQTGLGESLLNRRQ